MTTFCFPRVVICGGGIIGMSTAYYLLQKGVTPVLIERNEVAGTASGKEPGNGLTWMLTVHPLL